MPRNNESMAEMASRMLEELEIKCEAKRRQEEMDRQIAKYVEYTPCHLDPKMMKYFNRSRVYRTVDEKLNYMPFKAYYTPTYTPIPSAYMEHGVDGSAPMEPIYSAGVGEPDAYGLLTIMGMTDLIAQGDSFKLVNMNDAYTIRDLIDQYVSNLEMVYANSKSAPPQQIKMSWDRLKNLRDVINNGILKYEVTKSKQLTFSALLAQFR